MKKVSILFITIDRYEITKRVIESNLNNSKYPFEIELFCADNGSSDKRIIEFVSNHPLKKYHRINSKNEGVAKTFNQLYLRATGDFICLMGNDIEMPYNWLNEMIRYADSIKDSGIIGADWGHGSVPPISTKFCIHAHWLNNNLNRVFGTWVFRRKIIEQIGLFNERFGSYGLEDSDFNERVNRSGFHSLYVPNLKSNHLCNDVGENSEYRKMKDISMQENLKIYQELVNGYDKGLSLVTQLPEMRNTL